MEFDTNCLVWKDLIDWVRMELESFGTFEMGWGELVILVKTENNLVSL